MLVLDTRPTRPRQLMPRDLAWPIRRFGVHDFQLRPSARAHTHEDEGKVLVNVADGELLHWLRPETEAEESYIAQEPRRAREGWSQSEKSFRESEYYRKRFARREVQPPDDGDREASYTGD